MSRNKPGPRPKRVIAMTSDGAMAVSWPSLRDAARELGASEATLRTYMSHDWPYRGLYLDLEPDGPPPRPAPGPPTAQLRLFTEERP